MLVIFWLCLTGNEVELEMDMLSGIEETEYKHVSSIAWDLMGFHNQRCGPDSCEQHTIDNDSTAGSHSFGGCSCGSDRE